jgi:prophage regulatory protein
MPQTNTARPLPTPLNASEHKPPLRFVRLTEVMRMTGLRKTTIYQLQSDGEFPQRVQITANCVGWIESEVQNWLNERAGGRPAAIPTGIRSMPPRPGLAAIR